MESQSCKQSSMHGAMTRNYNVIIALLVILNVANLVKVKHILESV